MREMTLVLVHVIEHRVLPHLHDSADRADKCSVLISDIDSAWLLRGIGYGGRHVYDWLGAGFLGWPKVQFFLRHRMQYNKNYINALCTPNSRPSSRFLMEGVVAAIL
jgi:hypothetical protein